MESFNFLGFILDEGLSWKKHTDVVRNKIPKVVGILYKLNNIFPRYILQTLYNSLIASYINYGLLLWGAESYRIELLQKRAIRLISFYRKFMPNGATLLKSLYNAVKGTHKKKQLN